MPKTIQDSIRKISKPQGVLDVATITDVNVLARDTNGVVLSVAPSVTGNIHGIGGLQRIELSAGIDPLKLNVGDQLHVTQVQGRYMAVATMPISNRTKGGGESYGAGEGADYIPKPQMLHGLIAGSSLELTWQPVLGASYYEIWASDSADPSSPDATVVDRTSAAHWSSKGNGLYFDDSRYYTVVPHLETGTLGLSGAPADWVQPAFVGNYATGMTSKNQTTNIPGSLTVTKAGSILRADVTSLNNPQPFNLDVCDPMGTHPTTAPFAVNDILRMVDVSGNALWVKVTATSNQTTFWRYAVTKQSPSAGTNYTITSGSAVADWGQSGQGVFAVSADGTFGAGTLWEIVTHAGSPWTTLTQQVYADSTGKVFAGAGAVTLDVNGIAITSGVVGKNKIRWVTGANLDAEIYGSRDDHSPILTVDAIWSGTDTAAQILLNATSSTKDSHLGIISDETTTAFASFYGVGFTGVKIGGTVIPATVSALLHLSSTAPTTLWEDTTASAKDLLLTVDANLATFSENGGAAPNLLVLDLANARVGIGKNNPAVAFDVTGEIRASSKLRVSGSTTALVQQNRITVANNGVAQLSVSGAANIAWIFISCSSGDSGSFVTKGGANATSLVSAGGGAYSATATTAGDTNVYWSAGNSRYEIENKTGSSRNYDILEFAIG